jgi:hypothetical protein
MSSRPRRKSSCLSRYCDPGRRVGLPTARLLLPQLTGRRAEISGGPATYVDRAVFSIPVGGTGIEEADSGPLDGPWAYRQSTAVQDVEPWAKVERLAALDRDAAAVNAGPNRLAARRAVSVAV